METSQTALQFLALAQSEGIEYFCYNNENGEDIYYTGATQEFFDQKEQSICNDPDLESREAIDEKINEWIEESGFTLLEDEFEINYYDDNVVEYAGGEYLVIDDYTANQLWEQSLDNYLEECIYPELSGSLSQYFDDEKWKIDARMDGRGHSLSSYDGNEYNETVQGESFCIFRIN